MDWMEPIVIKLREAAPQYLQDFNVPEADIREGLKDEPEVKRQVHMMRRKLKRLSDIRKDLD